MRQQRQRESKDELPVVTTEEQKPIVTEEPSTEEKTTEEKTTEEETTEEKTTEEKTTEERTTEEKTTEEKTTEEKTTEERTTEEKTTEATTEATTDHPQKQINRSTFHLFRQNKNINKKRPVWMVKNRSPETELLF